jgi:dolichol-phosphate mannosyltransferase
MRLAEADSRVKMVQLSRNFGYQGGLTAGLHYCRGEWVAILDGDQQDPPELIADMLNKALNDNFDVVYGYRQKRIESTFRKVMFWAFYRLWRWMSNIEVPLDAGEFCIMHRRVVDTINRMPEKQRFTRGLRSWAGFRQIGLPYQRKGRGAGETKYNIGAAINLALDGLLSHSVLPLRFITLIGFIIMTAATLLVGFNIIANIIEFFGFAAPIDALPPGLTQVNMLIVVFFGFNLLCLGAIGEYVGRIYEETKGRPVYVIKDILDLSVEQQSQMPSNNEG